MKVIYLGQLSGPVRAPARAQPSASCIACSLNGGTRTHSPQGLLGCPQGQSLGRGAHTATLSRPCPSLVSLHSCARWELCTGPFIQDSTGDSSAPGGTQLKAGGDSGRLERDQLFQPPKASVI